MSVLLISGSPASPSRTARLAEWLARRLDDVQIANRLLHLRDLSPQALLGADSAADDIAQALLQVSQAQAVVIATPIYKAAYSGLLKSFLDILPQQGLAGKLVLPLASGGSLAHLLALDYALRPVLAALGAQQILPAVYATDAQTNWTAATGLQLNDELKQRLQEALHHLRTELAWQKMRHASALAATPDAVSYALAALPCRSGARANLVLV